MWLISRIPVAHGLGPTGGALIQSGPWTYGAFANHVWSVAGESDRDNVSSTFIQPFLAYTTPTAWTYLVQTESTYDWRVKQWSVPINLSISKLTAIGSRKVQFQLGGRYWAESPSGGPEDFGISFKVTFLLALVATSTGDGIVDLPGISGSAAFALATVNLGSTATITASPRASVPLNVVLTICETNPTTGACLPACAGGHHDQLDQR